MLFLKPLIKRDVFSLFLIIFLASSLIMAKGSVNYGSDDGPEADIKNYINRKALPVLLNNAHSAELNNMASFISPESQNYILSPINTVHQTALLAFNSIENNLSDLNNNRGNQIITYVIQEGDTLSFIASDFGVSVNTIIWANNLSNINSLRPGDEIKIPPVNGVVHKVKKGDTVASLAKKYAADEAKIIAFNFLPQDGALQTEKDLIIPDGKKSSPIAPNRASSIKRFAYLPNLGDFFMLPTFGRNWGIIHGRNGVDVANSCGTPIYAAADGVAAIADAVGWNGGFGKFVKLVHANGTETVYAHNSKLSVGQGETVKKGQRVATMGSTGKSTGCHLHFEVHGARNPLAKY